MATGLFKCAYCDVSVQRNATMVHTEREPGLWDLDCTMCRDCFKQFKGLLEKVKSQKAWTGWAAREQQVDALQEENESLKSELQFLRQGDIICERLLIHDPHNEVVTVTVTGCAQGIKAHRSILITRSEVFKKVLTSEEYKMQLHDGRNRYPGHISLNMPMHADSFQAFINFLYTAELRPGDLQDHAADLIRAADLYEIPILKRKCEGFIVRTATPENAVELMKLGNQCKSSAITAAAVEQIRSNLNVYSKTDFEALNKTDPTVLANAFSYIIFEPPKSVATETTVTNSDRAESPAKSSVPGADPNIHSALPSSSNVVRDRWSLGTCTCSVHPFAHSGHEYHGVYFNTVTPQPSNVNYVDMKLLNLAENLKSGELKRGENRNNTKPHGRDTPGDTKKPTQAKSKD